MTAALNRKLDPIDDAIYEAGPITPWGGSSLWLTCDDLDEYNRDPDLYAARHFGFATAEQYREWVKTDGTALCSEHTKRGHHCRNSVGQGMQLNPVTWLQLHRLMPCHAHEGRLQ